MSNNKSHILVAYFSRKGQNYANGSIIDLKQGNTAVVAGLVSDMLDSDSFEIEPLKAYPDNYHECKKIAFQYYDYNAQKEKTLKNGGQEYIFSPYYMVWNGDCYYMVGYSEKHQNIGNFRMDRIYQQPTILDEPAAPVPTNFNILSHRRRWRFI